MDHITTWMLNGGCIRSIPGWLHSMHEFHVHSIYFIRSSKYGIPMYITETGIADMKDDRRAVMIDAYFKAVRTISQ